MGSAQRMPPASRCRRLRECNGDYWLWRSHCTTWGGLLNSQLRTKIIHQIAHLGFHDHGRPDWGACKDLHPRTCTCDSKPLKTVGSKRQKTVPLSNEMA